MWHHVTIAMIHITGIDQTFAILANRCEPQAASRAKLKEVRYMHKQLIFCWHQDGKIQNLKETEGHGKEVFLQVPAPLSFS